MRFRGNYGNWEKNLRIQRELRRLRRNFGDSDGILGNQSKFADLEEIFGVLNVFGGFRWLRSERFVRFKGFRCFRCFWFFFLKDGKLEGWSVLKIGVLKILKVGAFFISLWLWKIWASCVSLIMGYSDVDCCLNAADKKLFNSLFSYQSIHLFDLRHCHHLLRLNFFLATCYLCSSHLNSDAAHFFINAVFELIYSLCIVYTIYKFCCCFFFFFVFYIFFLLSSRLHFHLNFHFKSKISCCCHLILVIYIMNISHLFVRTVTFLSLSALPEHSLHLRVILNDNKILKLTFGFFFLGFWAALDRTRTCSQPKYYAQKPK